MVTLRRRLLLGAVTLLVLLLVVVLVLVVVLTQPEDCGVPGCSFVGGCRAAESVTCDLNGEEGRELRLTQLKLAPSIREVVLSNAARVELDEDALKGLDNLQSVKLQNIGTAVLRNTFSADSVVQHILLENIANLTTEGLAFQGTVGNLVLREVSMETCNSYTFGSHIDTLTLISVKLNRTKNGCVSATRRWRRLVVQSCDIHSIGRFTFQGNIDQVTIADTEIGTISEKGFDLGVSNFSATDCVIHKMEKDALAIEADDLVYLRWLIVRQLDRGALALFSKRDGARNRLHYSQVFVGNVTGGSLSDAKSEFLLNDHVLRPPCKCDNETRVHELRYRDDQLHSEPTDADQCKLLRLLHTRPCQAHLSPGALAASHAGCCSCCSDESPLWVLLVVILILFAVVVALLASAVFFVRRRRRGVTLLPRLFGKAERARSNADGRVMSQDPEHKRRPVSGCRLTAVSHKKPKPVGAALSASPQPGEGGTGLYAEVVMVKPAPVATGTSLQSALAAVGCSSYAEVTRDKPRRDQSAMCQGQPDENAPLITNLSERSCNNPGAGAAKDRSSDASNRADMHAKVPPYSEALEEKDVKPDVSHYASTNGRFPEYAKISKDTNRNTKTSHPTDTITEFPMYAKVLKNKKKNNNIYHRNDLRTGYSEHSELSNNTKRSPDMSRPNDADKGYPVYAEVLKGRNKT